MNTPPALVHFPIQHAMHALLRQFIETIQLRKENSTDFSLSLTNRMDAMVNSKQDFLQKTKLLDEVVGEFPAIAPLKEYLFDMLLTHFLSSEVQMLGEEYLESEAWQHVEEEILDRGTELLNLLLYINEALEDDVEISMDDFLKEFLLTEEDEFQDEHRIYEDIIANQELLEADAVELVRVWKTQIAGKSAMEDLFIPFFIFFSDPEALMPEAGTMKLLMTDSEIPASQPAILQAIYSFKNGFHESLNLHSN